MEPPADASGGHDGCDGGGGIATADGGDDGGDDWGDDGCEGGECMESKHEEDDPVVEPEEVPMTAPPVKTPCPAPVVEPPEETPVGKAAVEPVNKIPAIAPKPMQALGTIL